MSFKRVGLLIGVGGGGGLLGWLAHTGISKFEIKPEDQYTDIMSSKYKATPWNRNWDKRAPSSLVKNDKSNKNSDNSNSNNSEELKKVTPTASRHL